MKLLRVASEKFNLAIRYYIEMSRSSGKHQQSRLTASFSHNRPSADCLSQSYQSAVSVSPSCVMPYGFSLHMVILIGCIFPRKNKNFNFSDMHKNTASAENAACQFSMSTLHVNFQFCCQCCGNRHSFVAKQASI
jgi:hypothetical protein